MERFEIKVGSCVSVRSDVEDARCGDWECGESFLLPRQLALEK